MIYDTYLVSQAEALADGRHAHIVANMVAAYKGAYQMALDAGTDFNVDLFNRAERELVMFVAIKKSENLDIDEFLDEERYKPHRHAKPAN
jgi:hypothetical protein